MRVKAMAAIQPTSAGGGGGMPVWHAVRGTLEAGYARGMISGLGLCDSDDIGTRALSCVEERSLAQRRDAGAAPGARGQTGGAAGRRVRKAVGPRAGDSGDQWHFGRLIVG